MTVAHPLLLVLGLLVAGALAVLVRRLHRARSAALAGAGIVVPDRRRPAAWLSLGGIALLAVAAAGPAAELPVGRSAGTVILAMDVSNSMTAGDVAPTRLAAAQQAALAFIDAQPDTVDIGVVGFDQGALTTSLPGADRAVTKGAVQNLRTSGGTSLAAAILGSMTAVTGRSVTVGEDGALPDLGYWGSATIVLFSDGEDGAAPAGGGTSDAVTEAATIAQNAGVHIETVGVGTAEGAAVEIDGYSLHTALDADQLIALAENTGGTYRPASDGAQLAAVASSVDLRLTVSKQQVPVAGGFILAALALLAVGALLTGVRTGRLV